MSEPYINFPDVERLVVDLLKDRTVQPPNGFDGAQRAVLVSRVGGAWAEDPRLALLTELRDIKRRLHALETAQRVTTTAAAQPMSTRHATRDTQECQQGLEAVDSMDQLAPGIRRRPS